VIFFNQYIFIILIVLIDLKPEYVINLIVLIVPIPNTETQFLPLSSFTSAYKESYEHYPHDGDHVVRKKAPILYKLPA